MSTVAESKKKEIYTYKASWTIYGMNFSVRPDHKFRLALGSFVEEYNNKVEIVQLNEDTGKFISTATFDHPYPTTKIMWAPLKSSIDQDLLATTGEYLRIWRVGDEGVTMKALLNNNKNSEFCAPLTSFDWNDIDPTMIGTSSIDTTCTIWNAETGQAKTQLIAHNKEVYDIAFAPDANLFTSVGADGSVRLFDLRAMDHSTILFESPGLVPLLRLAWNKSDHNYIATFMMDNNKVIILDVRSPSLPVAELAGHSSSVNSIAWAPHSACHICTAGEDKSALIWDLSNIPRPVEDPILAYTAVAEVNTLQWSIAQPDWIGINFNKTLQILRV